MTKHMFSQPGRASSIRGALAALFAAGALLAAPGASASLLTWSVSGPGTEFATHAGNLTTLTYSDTAAWRVWAGDTWTATAVAADAGDYSFNWDFSGFNAWFNVTAFLNASSTAGTASLVNVGPSNCCTMPSGGFDYAGTYTFANVHAGDTLKFTFGGKNIDFVSILSGNLRLEQLPAKVPEPASLALLGLGLAGCAVARRRRA